MGSRYNPEIDADAIYGGCDAAFHNDILDQNLFPIKQKPLPEIAGAEFILVEVSDDDAVATLREITRRKKALIRSMPCLRRWNGRKGHVVVTTVDADLRRRLAAAAKDICCNKIIL